MEKSNYHYYQFSLELLCNLLKNNKSSSTIIINNSAVKTTTTTTKHKNKKGNKNRYLKRQFRFNIFQVFNKKKQAFRKLQKKPQTLLQAFFYKHF